MNRLTKFTAGLGLAAALLLAPAGASAQIAILPKVGTGGLGADLTLGLSDRVGLRAGLGFAPFEVDGIEIDGNSYSGSFPDYFAIAGLDLKVIGPLRLIGGVMIRSGDFEFEAEIDGEFEFNDQIYTESGTFTGVWENSAVAPYAGIGFFDTFGSGVGFYIDTGVVFAGDPEVTGELGGNLATVVPPSDFEAELQNINDELPSYAQYYPFLQFGLKIGIG